MGNMRDWTNREDYAFTEHLSMERWAWEFLRRNPDYQTEWKEEMPAGLSYFDSLRKAVRKDGPHGLAPCLSEIKPDDVYTRIWAFGVALQAEQLQEIDKNHPSFCFPSKKARKNWHILGYVNPEQDNPDTEKALIFVDTYSRYCTPTISREDTAMVHNFRKTEFAYPFDLRFPLKDQFKKAGQVLRKKQTELGYPIRRPERPIKPDDIWTRYLRILDAYEAGAKRREIAGVIFEKEHNVYPEYTASDKVRKSYDRAKKLCTPDGYLNSILP